MIQVRRILQDNIRLILIGAGLISLYLIISIFLLDKDPVISLVGRILGLYLHLVERMSSLLLSLTGSPAEIIRDQINPGTAGFSEYLSLLRYKKIPVIALLIIWLTRTETRDKIWFTVGYFLLHFILLSSYYAIEAHSLVADDGQAYFLIRTHYLVSILLLISVFFAWYLLKKEAIILTLKKFKIYCRLFEGNAIPVFIAIYLFIIIDNFPAELNSYQPWIQLILISAQKILGVFGYEASVEQFSLIGTDGIINMGNGCLGLGTMFLFASIVYLTGKNNVVKWVYMVAGVILLNIVNVVRFVLLFIYIQNHEISETMNLHATYTYTTYTIILLMWILWFEKFIGQVKAKAG
jgi:exosortase/archaeosortase family protein